VPKHGKRIAFIGIARERRIEKPRRRQAESFHVVESVKLPQVELYISFRPQSLSYSALSVMIMVVVST
jgi:hypothetical protein